jgi:DNA-binding MarR family transcriptional regulator
MLLSMHSASRVKTAALQSCTCFNLRKATRAVTQLYDEFLRPSNLRATQFSLLGVLAQVGTASISELAQAAVMDRTTLKRNLELLEREGLVRIRPGSDARVRDVSLTQAARDRLLAALPYWEEAQAHVTSRLGSARTNRFLSDLSAAVAAAQAET